MTTATLSQQVGTRQRWHSDELKADLDAACTQPGISIAAAAMAIEQLFQLDQLNTQAARTRSASARAAGDGLAARCSAIAKGGKRGRCG